MPPKNIYILRNTKKCFQLLLLISNQLLKKIYNTELNQNYSYTLNYQKGELLPYCLYVKSNIPDIINFKPIIYLKN